MVTYERSRISPSREKNTARASELRAFVSQVWERNARLNFSPCFQSWWQNRYSSSAGSAMVVLRIQASLVLHKYDASTARAAQVQCYFAVRLQHSTG